MQNLWPELEMLITDKVISPKNVLRVQAENLNQMTKGLLIGQLTTNKNKVDTVGNFETHFQHQFNIFSPALSYSFNLLTIEHPPIYIYPCKVNSELSDVDAPASSAKELEQILEAIFKHEKVIQALRSLILQSQEEQEVEYHDVV